MKTLLGKRELNDAVPALEEYGVKGLKTLKMLEDADIDEMMEKHKLPKMTGRLLKKELPSLVPALVQKRREEEEETKRVEEEAKRRLFEEAVAAAKHKEEKERKRKEAKERKRKEEEEESKRKKLVQDILKTLEIDASDNEFKTEIRDFVYNKSEELILNCLCISDEGAKALAEALKVNTALQKLDLDSNKISD